MVIRGGRCDVETDSAVTAASPICLSPWEPRGQRCPSDKCIVCFICLYCYWHWPWCPELTTFYNGWLDTGFQMSLRALNVGGSRPPFLLQYLCLVPLYAFVTSSLYTWVTSWMPAVFTGQSVRIHRNLGVTSHFHLNVITPRNKSDFLIKSLSKKNLPAVNNKTAIILPYRYVDFFE